MSKPHSTALILVIGLLIGCSQAPNAAAEIGQAAASTNKQVPGKLTALENVLNLFESQAGEHWASYRSASGISWDADSPDEYSKEKFELSGHLVLAGFGSVKLPNGKVGVDYAEVDGNEGQSGVTLNGTQNVVEGLSVKKFYFSEDYEEVLRKQFQRNTVVRKIAEQCVSDEVTEVNGKNSFFEVQVPGGKVNYVEAWLEEGGKYSPGYTVFDFYRNKPERRIAELKCSEIKL